MTKGRNRAGAAGVRRRGQLPSLPTPSIAAAKFRCNKKDTDAADLIEAQAAEIEKLKAKVPRRIPVEERLPESDGDVLLVLNGEVDDVHLSTLTSLDHSVNPRDGFLKCGRNGKIQT